MGCNWNIEEWEYVYLKWKYKTKRQLTQRFELWLRDLESLVLPLHHTSLVDNLLILVAFKLSSYFQPVDGTAFWGCFCQSSFWNYNAYAVLPSSDRFERQCLLDYRVKPNSVSPTSYSNRKRRKCIRFQFVPFRESISSWTSARELPCDYLSFESQHHFIFGWKMRQRNPSPWFN